MTPEKVPLYLGRTWPEAIRETPKVLLMRSISAAVDPAVQIASGRKSRPGAVRLSTLIRAFTPRHPLAVSAIGQMIHRYYTAVRYCGGDGQSGGRPWESGEEIAPLAVP